MALRTNTCDIAAFVYYDTLRKHIKKFACMKNICDIACVRS